MPIAGMGETPAGDQAQMIPSAAMLPMSTPAKSMFAQCEVALKGNEVPDVTNLKLDIASLESELQASHLRRLKSGKCNIVAGLLYGDIIVSFSKISQLCFSIIAQRKGLNP